MRAGTVFLAVAVACGLVGAPGSAAPDGEPTPYRVVPVKGGRVEGTCRLARAAEVPRLSQRKPCPAEIPSPRVVFDAKTLALADCVVSVDGLHEGKEWPEPMRGEERRALVEIQRCLYLPEVSWIRVRTQVAFANRDTDTKYVVHLYRGSDSVTQANFGVSEGVTIADDVSTFLAVLGKYLLRCDCPGFNMSGTILVVDHPYYAGPTSIDGRYALDEVPPGTHELVCWHEGLESTPVVKNGETVGYRYGPDVVLRAKATVVAGETTRVDFTIPVPER